MNGPGQWPACGGCLYQQAESCTNPKAAANGGPGLRYTGRACSGRAIKQDPRLFETKPRFRGCPPICLAENRPSFGNPAQAHEYFECYKVSGSVILRLFLCAACNSWHYDFGKQH